MDTSKMSYEDLASIKLEELKKYLRVFALSENNYEKREFALDLLLKLGAPQGLSEKDPSMGPSAPVPR